MNKTRPFKPLRLFYSYSHKDESLRQKLETHLKILQRQQIVTGWHDRAIEAGMEWELEIRSNLEQADIILLLVSADFLASDHCWDSEMERALERHREGRARVIPVILRPVELTDAPFRVLQALPKDSKAVITWPLEDEAWTDVVRGIRGAAEMLQHTRNDMSSPTANSVHSDQESDLPPLLPAHREVLSHRISKIKNKYFIIFITVLSISLCFICYLVSEQIIRQFQKKHFSESQTEKSEAKIFKTENYARLGYEYYLNNDLAMACDLFIKSCDNNPNGCIWLAEHFDECCITMRKSYHLCNGILDKETPEYYDRREEIYSIAAPGADPIAATNRNVPALNFYLFSQWYLSKKNRGIGGYDQLIQKYYSLACDRAKASAKTCNQDSRKTDFVASFLLKGCDTSGVFSCSLLFKELALDGKFSEARQRGKKACDLGYEPACKGLENLDVLQPKGTKGD